MMLKTLAASALAASVLLVTGGAAQATSLVAGWDFSQYFGDGAMTIDDTFAPVQTLDANYSDLDPTAGAGAESAQFGTFFYDGSNGSSNIPVDFSGNEAIAPVSAGGDLASNAMNDGPAPDFGSPGAFSTLSFEGQRFTEILGLLVQQSTDLVFGADLSALSGSAGSNWEFTFGALTFGGGESDMQLEVSTDGAAYSVVSTETLTDTDSPFSVSLGSALDGASQVFVRLGFGNDVPDTLPKLDNIGIRADVASVPEPGGALLGLAGLAGLGLFSRRRA